MSILFGLTLSAPGALGLALTYTETPVGSNFEYDFTLTNDLGTDIFELFLDVPLADGSLLSFSSPTGWGDGFGGDQPFHGPVLADTSYVQWYAALGSELGDGKSLPGFDFVSSTQISKSIAFSVNSDPEIGGTAQPEGAAPIPEPATMLLLGSGLVGLLGLRKKFKK